MLIPEGALSESAAHQEGALSEYAAHQMGLQLTQE